jgi:K+-transporting ATPase A subunit
MMLLLLMGLGVALWSEYQTNPLMDKLGVSGGNLEVKKYDSE